MGYSIVLVDYFSKFVWLRVIESKKNNSIAAFLNEIMMLFGRIGTLSADEGFKSNDIDIPLNKWGTKLRTSLPYNHQAMGPAERTNRTVREALLKTVIESTIANSLNGGVS